MMAYFYQGPDVFVDTGYSLFTTDIRWIEMDHSNADYLKMNWYCDHDHPEVVRQAKFITGHLSTDREKAVAIFYWVRDKVLYRLGFWQKRASETLLKREGTCTNAANLFVAMCRSVGIPAGYGVLNVFGKDYFGPVIPPLFRSYMNKKSVHIYATVFLDDTWLQVDPSDDYAFCRATAQFNPTAKLVEWDGNSHAMLHINAKDIIQITWPIAGIDEWMEKKPKNGGGARGILATSYVTFLRANTIPVASCDELQPLFVTYLRQNRFYLYFYWHYLKCLIILRQMVIPNAS